MSPAQDAFRRAREAHDFARYHARMTFLSMRAAGYRPAFEEREEVRALFGEDRRAAARDRAEDELVAWFCDFVAIFDAAKAKLLRDCARSTRLRVEVVDLAATTDLAALGPLLS